MVSCPPENDRDDRQVRSFVRRNGRITPAQEKALAELLPRYGVTVADGLIDPQQIFERPAPLVLEIGFGNGDALCWMAQQQPQFNFIGVEVYRAGIGHALRHIEEQQLSNVRVLDSDAVVLLKQHIAPASLQAIRIYFPDPWPKKRHHKRRLIQPEFVELASSRLQPGGQLHLATDWEHYAEQMLHVLSDQPQLSNAAGSGDGYADRPYWRPQTRFERRGLRLGHGVWDLLFQLRDGDH
ncbi:MAG: tRNA (guanosine(46)-N7)-methyltransferase TrmB [Wenzhouxiangellaceae bacterium]